MAPFNPLVSSEATHQPDPTVARLVAGRPRMGEAIAAGTRNPYVAAAGDLLSGAENVARGVPVGAAKLVTDLPRGVQQIGYAAKAVAESPGLGVTTPQSRRDLAAAVGGAHYTEPSTGEDVTVAPPTGFGVSSTADRVLNQVFQPEGKAGAAGQLLGGVLGIEAAGLPGKLRASRAAATADVADMQGARAAMERNVTLSREADALARDNRLGALADEVPTVKPRVQPKPVEIGSELPSAAELAVRREGVGQLPRAQDITMRQRGRVEIPAEPVPTPKPVAAAAGLGERGAVNLTPAEVAPAYKEAAGLIDFGGKESRRAGTTGGSTVQRVQRLGDQLANGLGPLERLGQTALEKGLPPTKNPKFLLSLVKGSRATVETAVKEGVPDPVTRQIVGPSFEGLFKPLGKNEAKIREALTYVVAERALGRGAQAFAGDEQAMAAFQRAADAGRADPAIQAFRQQYEAFTDALGQYAVKSGLWTPEMWARLKASDALYIPFKRVMGGIEGKSFGGAGGLANVTPGVNRFVGSRRMLMDPALSLAEYTDAIIRRADRYRVGASVFDAAKALGPEGDWLLTPLGTSHTLPQRAGVLARITEAAKAKGLDLPPDVLESVDDLHVPALDPQNPVLWRWGATGKRQYALVNAPDLVNALYSMNPSITGNAAFVKAFLDRTLLPLKRVFTATTTAFVPRFAGGTNPARDIPDALMKSTSGLRPDDIGVGLAEALGDVAGKSRFADEMKRFGLGNVSMFGENTRPSTFQRRFAPTTLGQNVTGTVGRYLMGDRSLLAGAERIGDASDLFTRLGEARAAIRKYGPKVASGEWSPADLRLYAATQGRGITLDFANKPGNPVLQWMGDYVPFMRPALQGPVRMAKAFKDSPVKAMGFTAGVAGLSAAAWALKHRSPTALATVNDRPSWERGGFALFPMDDNANFILRVPLGQEMALVYAGVQAGLDGWKDNDPHAADQFGQAMLRALPPGLSGIPEYAATGNPAGMVSIPGVQQMVENFGNQQEFGNRPVESARLQELPPMERRYASTPTTYSLLAKVFHTSPLKAENVTRGVLSQAAPLVTAATDPLATRLLGEDAPAVAQRPLSMNPMNPLSTFRANPLSQPASETRYYDLRTRIAQAQAGLSTAIRSGDIPLGQRTVRHQGPEASPDAAAVLSTVDDLIKTLRDADQAVRDREEKGVFTAHQAAQARIGLARQEAVIYRNAVTMLRKMGIQ